MQAQPNRHSATFEIRPARREDFPAIRAMIHALAEYEQLGHLCTGSEAELEAALFGPSPAAEVLVACKGSDRAAFVLFYQTFSTFLARRGLWLEDLYVRPEYRRQGCARQLLRTLAAIAVERGCGRFEWAVLDWNSAAIRFYRSLGATVLSDWRIVRVAGDALPALSGSLSGSTADAPNGQP